MKKKQSSGTSWFKLLQMELQMADVASVYIPIEIQPQDDVLGTASEESQRLYAYTTHLEEQATRVLVEARYERDETKKEELTRQGIEMRSKMSFLDHLLVMQLREEFGIWKPDVTIAIRKDFQVVAVKGQDSFADFLRRLGQ